MSEERETFISHSVKQTISNGRKIGDNLQAGDVVALQGNLGAGKTVFVKGIAEALGVERDEVHSPTFSLINIYDGRLPLYHMDFYRLEREQEAIEIGAEEYFYRDGVCVIEWPGKIQSLLPRRIIWITFEKRGPDMRQINITEKD